ncbi:MAG: glycoside hydrolase family 16 protein, partial [Candidatus Brocadiae bacterium]|nr:glycoside hydrolase family 16 protein [Candidatus Brocadiia bacterium]
NRMTNDAVAAVTISARHPEGAAALVVESIWAGLPPQPVLPDWLGKRPPVEGDWVRTFDEDFDGTALDLSKWNNTGPNYWDKTSHWSKDNLIVGGGVARLRYEKKTGRHNDEPDGKESHYQGGYLDTYGKWVQRYGYFEARMKLPTAPGLWPAFWMSPDRGEEAGEQWRRQSTSDGGMEIDVLEHLTRWGAGRYNIAMHWDGYGEGHKSVGSSVVYAQPDEDGFITAGLLWTPGLLVFYGNGQEVARWEDPRVGSVQSDMMFTLPMGGWDNSPLDDAQLPDDLVIDYVRVWQRRDLMQP